MKKIRKVYEVVRENHNRTIPTHDYLKYFRVVRYWAKAKYGLSLADTEMMFFLHSEGYFTKTSFEEFAEIMPWDKKRFSNLLKNEWIHVWRKRTGNNHTLYELSYKGKSMVNAIYRKLNGEEIAESPNINPLFKKKISYMDKVYRKSIKEMNKSIQQQRHSPLE